MPSSTGGSWAIPLLAFGLGLIAFVMIVPASDERAHLADERDRLQAQLDALEQQRDRNADFLQRIHDDPELAWRLIERQRPGEAGRLRAQVLAAQADQVEPIDDEFAELLPADAGEARATLASGEVDAEDETLDADVTVMGQVAARAFSSSPFALLASEPAAVPSERNLIGGMLANWCRSSRTRLFVLAAAGLACLFGLLGGGRGR